MHTTLRILAVTAFITFLPACSESKASSTRAAEPTHDAEEGDDGKDDGKDDEGGDVPEGPSDPALTCVQREDKPKGPAITTRPVPQPTPPPPPAGAIARANAKLVGKAFGVNAIRFKTAARLALPYRDGRKSAAITRDDRLVLEELTRRNVEAVLIGAFEANVNDVKVCPGLCQKEGLQFRGKGCVVGSQIGFAPPTNVLHKASLLDLRYEATVEIGCGCEK